MIPRRSPGQRRRRTRRQDELAQVEAADPARHAELLELRKTNPQAYRKELVRWVRRGAIARGRGYEVPDAALAWLALEPAVLAERVDEAIRDGDLVYKALIGLAEAERAGRARLDVLTWLAERSARLLAAENRTLR